MSIIFFRSETLSKNNQKLRIQSIYQSFLVLFSSAWLLGFVRNIMTRTAVAKKSKVFLKKKFILKNAQYFSESTGIFCCVLNIRDSDKLHQNTQSYSTNNGTKRSPYPSDLITT